MEAVIREGVLEGTSAGEVDSTSTSHEHPLDSFPCDRWNRHINDSEDSDYKMFVGLLTIPSKGATSRGTGTNQNYA